MTYWAKTMQDDVYLIAQSGWKAEINTIKNNKGKQIGWDSDLIPKNIVKEKYFLKERDALESLQKHLHSINQEMQTMDEENEGEDDMFSETRSDEGKITKGKITDRIKIIKNDPEYVVEFNLLVKYQNLMDKEGEVKRESKAMERELDKNLLIRYKHLIEDEVKELVIEHKWLVKIHALVSGELEGISHKLARRIKELSERYEIPLPILLNDVQILTKNVDNHLVRMGFE